MYATHPYGGPGRERRSRFWDSYWGSLTATDPVIVTEFGDTTTCTDDYAREVLDYADAHGAGWTAWAWFPGGCAFPSLVTDWSAIPSAVGDTVKAYSLRYDDPAAAAPPGWPHGRRSRNRPPLFVRRQRRGLAPRMTSSIPFSRTWAHGHRLVRRRPPGQRR